LKRAGADIRDVLCIIDRGNGQNIVEEKTGYKVKTLVKIEVVDGKVQILK